MLHKKYLILSVRNQISKKELDKFEKGMFKYSKLKDKPKQFKYLCGLTVLQFQLLYNCVAPYCHLIEYPDCKGTGTRFLEKKTELFSVLTLCRHALHLGVIGFTLDLFVIHNHLRSCIVYLGVSKLLDNPTISHD